ncbi:MAG TPA: cyclic nucleotide-binding domain-containing protein [Myxococcales bacterium]|nr:cyclic nucleotide-binding domain-containing protein [Myxococcales bacterium]
MTDTMTLVEKTVFMSTVEVMQGIPTEALAQLAARAGEVRVDRGRMLFREGDEDQGAFIVVEGELELRKGATTVRVLTAGMAHGELFLGENEPHQYTALALDDTHLLNLQRSDVMDALTEYPEFGLAMVQDLALRLHKLTERFVEMEAELKLRGELPSEVMDGQPIEPSAPPTLAPRQSRWWQRRRKSRTT